ncbi:MAG: acyl carrier protein [Acidobacteria bacterium]|nr:acyl carrier protein [Acidobacteriota bacterium]
MNEIRDRLQQVFRQVFDDEQLVLAGGMSAKDIEDWDSLQHINLIIAVEKQFGIRFATAEISQLKEPGQNIGTFTRLLEGKVKGARS